MVQRQLRQGPLLVRQRVGLLEPRGRPARKGERDDAPLRRRSRRRSRASACSSASTSTCRSTDGGSPTTRASARRCRRSGTCSSTAPTSWSARTSAGRRARPRPELLAAPGGRARWPSCLGEPVGAVDARRRRPTRARCSRTCASTRARRRTTRPFAAALAALADLYVNDAFGTAHRAHASTEGVAHLLPAAAGLLIEEELDAFRPAARRAGAPVRRRPRRRQGLGQDRRDRPRSPGNADALLIGGAMAYTFLTARRAARRQVAGRGRPPARRRPAGAWPTRRRAGASCVLPVDVVVADRFAARRRGAHRARSTRSRTAGWASTSGPRRSPATRAAARRRADGLLERPDGRLRDRAVRARARSPSPRPSPTSQGVVRWSAAATRWPRCNRPASPTASRTSRPAAARRSSSSRARTLPGVAALGGGGMSRRPLIAGNWKMHKTGAEAAAFLEALLAPTSRRASTRRVCPAVHGARRRPSEPLRARGVAVARRTCTWPRQGAFTGEVSAGDAARTPASHGVMIGHSERRQLFGETDAGGEREGRAARMPPGCAPSCASARPPGSARPAET